MGKAYIQLYDRSEKTIKILMVFSILLFIVGLGELIYTYLDIGMSLFALNIWNSWFLVIQGISIFYILYSSLKFKKFYISWNNDEIIYHFPKGKQPESIRIDEIQSIHINEAEIEILLKDSELKIINLNYVFIPKRTYIKEYFESLRNTLFDQN